MKHKVGDKVRIKSEKWYNRYKNKFGNIQLSNDAFTESMSEYCGREAVIVSVCSTYYALDIDNGKWYWEDDMFDEVFINMKKEDLKAGMLVEFTNGEYALVIPNYENELGVSGENVWFPVKEFDKDLKYGNYTVQKVFSCASHRYSHTLTTVDRTLLWVREKFREITMDEIAEKFNIPVEQLKIVK